MQMLVCVVIYGDVWMRKRDLPSPVWHWPVCSEDFWVGGVFQRDGHNTTERYCLGSRRNVAGNLKDFVDDVDYPIEIRTHVAYVLCACCVSGHYFLLARTGTAYRCQEMRLGFKP